ncbi:hypothetical protein DPEC_G00034060 [Dallia pectoralis]|uniref:Uncharacterized protein n=1 Tax=Dallia pectoralis TaxID=75939 RepID=A0ACC2HD05_DALPE|nr:hypothetical protein DPEC_G00034060 [Dallia pectoralis]
MKVTGLRPKSWMEWTEMLEKMEWIEKIERKEKLERMTDTDSSLLGEPDLALIKCDREREHIVIHYTPLKSQPCLTQHLTGTSLLLQRPPPLNPSLSPV